MAASGSWDPRKMPWSGIAVHGNTPFDTTLMTEIEDGLFLGGCVRGIKLPEEIEYVVSLYPWEAYELHGGVRGVFSLWEQDSLLDEEMLRRIDLASDVALTFRDLGPTLIHCRAGLNRSSLVMARMLSTEGSMSVREAISLIRAKRSPACLCNPYFEDWLLAQE